MADGCAEPAKTQQLGAMGAVPSPGMSAAGVSVENCLRWLEGILAAAFLQNKNTK